MVQKLSDKSVRGWLKSREGWRRKGQAIVKDYTFSSFRDAIVFVNRLATIADEAKHHPDIDIRAESVRVTLTTRTSKGVTEADLTMAEQIDFATVFR